MSVAISGHEIPYVAVEPAGTIYLHGRYGEHLERSVTVSSNEENLDFQILRATSNLDDKITYKVEPASEKGKYQITVYKNPILPTLMTSGTIYLHTNSEVNPKTELQVHVITKGDINVTPAVVNFGQVKFAEGAGSGQEVTRSVIVSKALGEFKITDVKLSNPNFRAAVEPVGAGSQYRVQVTFTPPIRAQGTQNETAEMIIHTDDAREPAIRVAVSVRAM
jgi:hypothetical protein